MTFSMPSIAQKRNMKNAKAVIIEAGEEYNDWQAGYANCLKNIC
jgi:hypothetical protein